MLVFPVMVHDCSSSGTPGSESSWSTAAPRPEVFPEIVQFWNTIDGFGVTIPEPLLEWTPPPRTGDEFPMNTQESNVHHAS